MLVSLIAAIVAALLYGIAAVMQAIAVRAASNKPADEELSQTEGGTLQNRTHCYDNGSGNAVGSASVLVAHGKLEEGAEECPNLIGRDHEAQKRSIWIPKGSQKGRGGRQAAHVAKVIAKEQEADGTAKGDGIHEILAFEAKEGRRSAHCELVHSFQLVIIVVVQRTDLRCIGLASSNITPAKNC